MMNHLEMIEIGSHCLYFSFSSLEVGTILHEFFPFEGWCRRAQGILCFYIFMFHVEHVTCSAIDV